MVTLILTAGTGTFEVPRVHAEAENSEDLPVSVQFYSTKRINTPILISIHFSSAIASAYHSLIRQKLLVQDDHSGPLFLVRQGIMRLQKSNTGMLYLTLCSR